MISAIESCRSIFPGVLFSKPRNSRGVEKAMAPHSSPLAWKIPWTEEPGGLQSMGSLRVGHDSLTSLSLFTFMHWRRKWQPTPVFLPGESRDGRVWWAAVYGVAQSRTRLKQLSSSSSSGRWILYHLSYLGAHKIYPEPLHKMLLRKEFFASLDTTQAKLVGNLRKCDPAGIMAVENPRGWKSFL